MLFRATGKATSVAALTIAALLSALPARAEMVLSKVIVDLRPGQRASDDIEVWNDGPDRIYVVAEPSAILFPGTPAEQRVPAIDPIKSGLLVSPQRIILEPGERRQVRVATILPRAECDRVFRVTIKPVAGPITASKDALKVFVGYDVLVLQRPAALTGAVEGKRQGKTLTLRNTSNTAWEVFSGQQCRKPGGPCDALPAARLYSGAQISVALPGLGDVEYKAIDGTSSKVLTF